MGYHLRRCSYCNRYRLFKRMDRNQPHPDDLTAEELRESFNRKIEATRRKDSTASESIDGGTAHSPSSGVQCS